MISTEYFHLLKNKSNTTYQKINQSFKTKLLRVTLIQIIAKNTKI